MAKDARSYIQTLVTATASLNNQATPLNTMTGSPNFGYRVNFLITSLLAATLGTGGGSIVPQLYAAPASTGPWTTFWQGSSISPTTASQSVTHDALIALNDTAPYIAGGVAITAGGSTGYSVAYQIAIATGKEDRA